MRSKVRKKGSYLCELCESEFPISFKIILVGLVTVITVYLKVIVRALAVTY